MFDDYDPEKEKFYKKQFEDAKLQREILREKQKAKQKEIFWEGVAVGFIVFAILNLIIGLFE